MSALVESPARGRRGLRYERSIAFFQGLAEKGHGTEFSEREKHLFIHGYCGLYVAALLAEHPDWVAVAVGSKYCQLGQQDCSQYGGGLCDCNVGHFYAKDGNGWYHDAYGEHDPSALHDHVTVSREVNDLALRCVLETWYGDEYHDYDIAAWASILVAG